MRWISVGCLALAGCSDGKGDDGSGDVTFADTDADTDTDTDTDTDADTDADADADTDTDTDADTDTDTDTDTGTIGLPDPFAGLSATCGTSIATMNYTSYYVGELQISGTTVSGTETMAFYPSPDLETTCALPPSCLVVWDLTGTVETTSQPSYDYAISVDATRSLVRTTCDDVYMLLWEPDTYAGTYAVAENLDGTSTVGFESSGAVFGEGHWSGGNLTYVSGSQCAALPDTPPCP